MDDGNTPMRPLGAVDKSFYLIGVGASAGGLDAIKQLISQVPPDFSHSLVIVQHISPDYKSLMSEILGRETSLSVVEVEDDMPVEPGHIYLIPPRSNLVIQGTEGDSSAELHPDPTNGDRSGLRFSLVDPTPRPALNLPIDVFLSSLSEAVGDRAIAVVLSGSGSDGSRGLRSIKDREGFVLVQDPDTAAFDGMPQSAISTGIVDMVLAPDAMIGEIWRYIEMRERGIDSVERVFNDVEQEFADLLKLVSDKTDIDFSLYKSPTLKRRVARRMALKGQETLHDYLELLKKDSAELNILHREFLVGVTNFFRDRPVWDALEDIALPELFKRDADAGPVRVWSVGCSTGEEAYTLAMLLQKFCTDNDIDRDFRVFATDVNENAIAAAKQGVYPDSVHDEIPPTMIERGYVSFQSGTFKVSRPLRNKVFFSAHNVIDDAPYTRTDLIVCRNLLIYLSPDVQAKVMAHFAYSLRKGGFLMLGAAEGPGQHGGYFEAVAHKPRIYRNTRLLDASQRRGNLSSEFPVAERMLPRNRRMGARRHSPTTDMADMLQETLTEIETCVCVVDDQYKVLRTFGDHQLYLHMPKDGFSANVIELVEDNLRSAVALVLRRAETEDKSEKRGIRMVEGPEIITISVSCRRLAWEAQSVAYSLTFRRQVEQVLDENAAGSDDENKIDTPTAAYVQHLESEVQSLQDMLSATAQDLGASNEELQTTNEELIASNEELQANNEETQSINEELHTLNAENADKIAELEAATADISNLLATADLGVLVLDESFHIRQFSTGLSAHVKLEPTDIGRPIANFSLALEPDATIQLMDDARQARDYGKENAREMRSNDGGWVFARIRPYRTVHGESRGVVIALQDITPIKLLELEVRNQRDRLEGLLESEAAGYWDWNIPAHTEFMSPRFKSMFGYEEHEIEDSPDAWQRLIHQEDLPRVMDSFKAHVDSKGELPYDNEVRYWHKNGSIVWVLCRGRVVEWDKNDAPVRMMGVHVDITHLKKREAEIQARANELRRFAFIAAHDLVQPVNTIENALMLLTEDLPETEDPDQKMALEYLSSATGRMRARIGGILDYARMQDETLSFEPVNLNQTVQDAVKDLEVQIKDSGADITLSDLPTASGAPSLLLQVVQNLMSNAIKYRASDRTCVIEVAEAKAPDGMVAFVVRDNGIGIPEEHRQRVFDLFARLHTDQEYSGNGIGLSLCERIVAQHGGTISVSDGIDGGSAFTVVLKEG
ncbi:MAG: chemotaxis protein CheB [Pseudomonadota bacterium]